jgi:CheY-like chemotaxis protein
VTGSAVAIVDVTAARETEERLRELNETLEARVAERTAEAERRAHQLRALASELSQTEWRERQRLAAVLHDHLQQVLVGAKFNLEALKGSVLERDLLSLAGRVDELLDQSLAECRSLTVNLSPPVLQEGGLTGGLAWLSRRMREQHGLEVDVAVDDGFVEPADGGVKFFLYDAVRELLFNVVKHSGVRAARVFLGRKDGQIEIRVEDRGKGLDPDFPRDRGDESAGFGLFSLRQRLELIGGAMRLESAPGKGTSVTLIAPAGTVPERNGGGVAAPARPPAEETEVASSRPKRDGRIRVVIADDHKILRQGLVALLNVEGGIDVVGEAADGVEAVELARSLQPDVVIMDIAMPRMNGIEATRQITSEMPGLRVIGLSMHEDETIAAAMREAGAVAFLTKGRPSDVLVSTIRAVLSGGIGP